MHDGKKHQPGPGGSFLSFEHRGKLEHIDQKDIEISRLAQLLKPLVDWWHIDGLREEWRLKRRLEMTKRRGVDSLKPLHPCTIIEIPSCTIADIAVSGGYKSTIGIVALGTLNNLLGTL